MSIPVPGHSSCEATKSKGQVMELAGGESGEPRSPDPSLFRARRKLVEGGQGQRRLTPGTCLPRPSAGSVPAAHSSHRCPAVPQGCPAACTSDSGRPELSPVHQPRARPCPSPSLGSPSCVCSSTGGPPESVPPARPRHLLLPASSLGPIPWCLHGANAWAQLKSPTVSWKEKEENHTHLPSNPGSAISSCVALS